MCLKPAVNNVVIWYKDQTAYSNGKYTLNPRVETLMNNSIILKNVQSEDAGNYYCEVVPENIRLHVILEINRALMITCDDRDVVDRTIIYRQGESHVCECKASGSSKTDIKWSLNVSICYNICICSCIYIYIYLHNFNILFRVTVLMRALVN